MTEDLCPYCEERARMSVAYIVELGPCPLHTPKSDDPEPPAK